MIKVEVIKQFTFERFSEIHNLQRKAIAQAGKLFVGDVFECSKAIADYLLGDNPIKEAVVKVIEVIPEAKELKKELAQFGNEALAEKLLKSTKKKSKTKK